MLLKIKVKPGSEKVGIKLDFEKKGQKEGPFLKIWVKSRPEKGRANRELSQLLKKIFGEYSFISGATSREKLIKVNGDIDSVLKSTSKFIKQGT